jgi:hypothetical protein
MPQTLHQPYAFGRAPPWKERLFIAFYSLKLMEYIMETEASISTFCLTLSDTIIIYNTTNKGG